MLRADSIAPSLQVCDPAAGNCTYFHLTYIRHEYIDPAVSFIVQGFTSN